MDALPARTARRANAAITFLLINDWELDFSEDELVGPGTVDGFEQHASQQLPKIFAGRFRPA